MSGSLPTFDTTSSASLDERTTWFLPGDNYMFVMGAAFFAVLLFLFTSAAKEPLLVRVVVAMIPMAACGFYLFTAVIGRPPHYAADWFAKLGRPKSFAVDIKDLDRRRTPRFLVC